MSSSEELVRALDPLLLRVGGRVVASEDVREGDVTIGWEGGPTVHVRLGVCTHATPPQAPATTNLSDGLARLIGDVEGELGGRLAHLPRAAKQRAVRLLEERGAFEMRHSAETVAEALGVTRFTVYNYLNRTNRPHRTPA